MVEFEAVVVFELANEVFDGIAGAIVGKELVFGEGFAVGEVVATIGVVTATAVFAELEEDIEFLFVAQLAVIDGFAVEDFFESDFGGFDGAAIVDVFEVVWCGAGLDGGGLVDKFAEVEFD